MGSRAGDREPEYAALPRSTADTDVAAHRRGQFAAYCETKARAAVAAGHGTVGPGGPNEKGRQSPRGKFKTRGLHPPFPLKNPPRPNNAPPPPPPPPAPGRGPPRPSAPGP